MGNRTQAVKFFNTALDALKDKSNKNALAHAYSLFVSSCNIDPTFGKAWYQQGNNNGDLGFMHAAIACYRRALQGDLDADETARTYCNLSWRCHQIGDVNAALAYAEKAIEAGPHMAYSWVNLSVAHGAFGQRLAAVAAGRKAYEIDPHDVTVQFSLAFALLFNENYQEGFRFFEARFPSRLQHYMTYPYPKWEGEKDKIVFLSADQGLGDTLSFSRFLPAASKKCKYIHCLIQPELMRCFNEAFTTLPNVNFLPSGSPFPQADVWSTFVSLPYALGLSDDQIRQTPHPRFTHYDVDTSWKVPDQKLHIGITWGGSRMNDIDRWRTIPVEFFMDFYKVPGTQLYSLQVDDHKEDLKHGYPALIKDLSPWVRDITDTFGILRHLDLVITAESALGHIAGAIDKDVWIPYARHNHDYRLGHDGSAILWYKHHKLFLQGPDKTWKVPFANMVDELRRRIDELDRKAKGKAA